MGRDMMIGFHKQHKGAVRALLAVVRVMTFLLNCWPPPRVLRSLSTLA